MIEFILKQLVFWITFLIEKIGYLGVFILMALESANFPIPSEIIMPFSGYLAYLEKFDFWIVVVIGALANVVGSLIAYWWGYLIRIGVIKKDPQEIHYSVKKTKQWLEKYGDWVIFLSRVVPVIRTFISTPLGILKTQSLWRFSYLTFFGSFLWSLFLTYLGYSLGKNWLVIEDYFRPISYLIIFILFLLLVWWFVFELRKKKGETKL